MIIPVCVKPMEDELFYGWLLRLALANGFEEKDPVNSFMQMYMSGKEGVYKVRSQTYKRLDYMYGLETECKKYNDIQCFPNVETILKQMMPVYALSSLQPYGMQVKKIEMILREKTGSIFDITQRDHDIQSLYMCPECMKEDIREHGEAYYHTWHHLPCVHVCAKHNIPLMKMTCWDSKEKRMHVPVCEENAERPTDVEYSIAMFMWEMYKNPLYVSLTELKLAMASRIESKGYSLSDAYRKLAEDFVRAGYGSDIHKEEQEFRSLLQGQFLVEEKAIPYIVFLFGQYSVLCEFVKKHEKGVNLISAGNLTPYELLKESKGILHLKCKKCGYDFHIHPYALNMGFGCPECDRKEDVTDLVNRYLSHLGDGKYKLYENASGNRKMKIIHEPCGKVRKADIQIILYRERGCFCRHQVSDEELQKRIDNEEYILVAYERKKNVPYITLQHRKSGEIFQIPWNVLERSSFYQCGDNSHNDEIWLENKIKELTGDEYELVESCQGPGNMIHLRHKKCGIITEMRQYKFLNGTRCRLCAPNINKKELNGIVMRCTGNEYWIDSIKGEKLTIKGINGEKFVKEAPYIIQELSRPSESEMFRNRVELYQPGISHIGEMYLQAKEYCEKYGVWIPDFDKSTAAYIMWRRNSHILVRQGYLYRQMDGIYSLEAEVSDDIIVEQKYLDRAGKKIGVYYGQSLAYRLGIAAKDSQEEYIVSNKGAKKPVSCKIGSRMIRVQKPFVPITNENYRIIEVMNLLMFLVEQQMYMPAVKEHIKKEKVDFSDIQPYIDAYPDSLKQVISEMGENLFHLQ